MAIAYTPVMPRKYDPNPRGSATKHVTMASDNPFERRVSVTKRRTNSMPGMGAIDTEALLAPVQAAQTSGGFDWGGLLKTGAEAAIQVGQTYAENRIEKLYGPQPQTLTAPSATLLPGQPGATTIPIYAPAPSSSKLPYVIGGVAVLGLVAFMVLRKKR